MVTLNESLRLVIQEDVIFAQAEWGTKVAHVARSAISYVRLRSA